MRGQKCKLLWGGNEKSLNLIVSASNRSAIIRVPGYAVSPKAKHFEYRRPDATANPYLAFSGLLMAGIDGIKKKMGPPPTTDKNLFELPEVEVAKIRTLPESLANSLEASIAEHAFLFGQHNQLHRVSMPALSDR